MGHGKSLRESYRFQNLVQAVVEWAVNGNEGLGESLGNSVVNELNACVQVPNCHR